MEILFVIGRVLFGGFFLMMGLNHFMKMHQMVGYAKAKGIPMPKIANIFTGLMMIFGGVAVLLWPNDGDFLLIGFIALAVFLFFTAIMMHTFWREQDPAKKMQEMVNFMKNMALLGATLIFVSQRLF